MIDRLVDFMLWDGIALFAFGGIIMLSIHLNHIRLGLLIAICIPIASIVMFGLAVFGISNVQPFLQVWVVIIMFFAAGLVMIPWFESPV